MSNSKTNPLSFSLPHVAVGSLFKSAGSAPETGPGQKPWGGAGDGAGGGSFSTAGLCRKDGSPSAWPVNPPPPPPPHTHHRRRRRRRRHTHTPPPPALSPHTHTHTHLHHHLPRHHHAEHLLNPRNGESSTNEPPIRRTAPTTLIDGESSPVKSLLKSTLMSTLAMENHPSESTTSCYSSDRPSNDSVV